MPKVNMTWCERQAVARIVRQAIDYALVENMQCTTLSSTRRGQHLRGRAPATNAKSASVFTGTSNS
jgi:hypothetical protein